MCFFLIEWNCPIQTGRNNSHLEVKLIVDKVNTSIDFCKFVLEFLMVLHLVISTPKTKMTALSFEGKYIEAHDQRIWIICFKWTIKYSDPYFSLFPYRQYLSRWPTFIFFSLQPLIPVPRIFSIFYTSIILFLQDKFKGTYKSSYAFEIFI